MAHALHLINGMIIEAGWILLVIAISGALALCVIRALNREHIWEAKRLFVFLTTALFILLQAALVETGWREMFFVPNRVEAGLAAAFARIPHPRLVAALAAAESEEARRALRWALAARGVRHLPPDSGLRRARLMEKVLGQADDVTCASLLRGAPSPETLRRSVEKLSDEDLREWIALSAAGAEAFLNGRPAPALGEKEMKLTLLKVAQVTPSPDFERAMDGFSQRKLASDTEVCWSGRRLHKTLSDLPATYGQALALLLTL